MTKPDDDNTLTIDELAAASRVPSRTIRFYQSRGALMAPEIRGRVAFYGKQHVERLKLIAQLQPGRPTRPARSTKPSSTSLPARRAPASSPTCRAPRSSSARVRSTSSRALPSSRSR